MERLSKAIDRQEYEQLPPIVRTAYKPDPEREDHFTLDLEPRGGSDGEEFAAARRREVIARAVHPEVVAGKLRRLGLDSLRVDEGIKRTRVTLKPDGSFEVFCLNPDGSYMVSRDLSRTFASLQELANDIVGKPTKETTAPQRRAVKEATYAGLKCVAFSDGSVEVQGTPLSTSGFSPATKLAVARMLGVGARAVERPERRTATPEDAKRLGALPPIERLRAYRSRTK